MPDQVTSQTKDPVKSEKVTDADLEAALEGKGEEGKQVELQEIQKEVKKEIKEVKEELRDKDGLTPAERSNMGRRLKKLEEMNEAVLSTLNELKEQMRSTPERQADSGAKKGLPEYISTPQDVLAIEDWVEEQEGNYAKDYMKTINQLSKKNPDEHEEIFKEMFDNFNVRRGKRRDPNTWNPYMDAQLNYAEARAAYYAKKLATAKPKLNVKGKETSVPTNLTVESEGAEEEAGKAVELDDFSMSFLKSQGKDSEWAKKAMR